jgi:NAD(P)-dependent dehydrogenase (short-subunit alcohol dehydrogenase family)
MIKTAVCVGGTGGIGRAIAENLASRSIKVIVVGRNESEGKNVVEGIKAKGGNAQFVKFDAVLLNNIPQFVSDLKLEKIDYLVHSAGMLRLGGRRNTIEELDDKMSLHYYSKFALIDECLPLLKNSSDARVLNVFAAGQGKLHDENDLGLDKNYTLTAAADSCTLYNDLMVQEFAERNSGIQFTHAFPGFVDTPLARGKYMHPIFKLPMKVLTSLFATSPADCAANLVDGWLNAKPGYMLMNEKGKQIEGTKWQGDAKLRQKIWDHTVMVLKRIKK